MHENLVIFIIVLLLALLLIGIGIGIWTMRNRLDITGTTTRYATTTAGDSDTTSLA
jgi:uncharacterized membrane protein AbrB (regulator of aidB expression)